MPLIYIPYLGTLVVVAEIVALEAIITGSTDTAHAIVVLVAVTLGMLSVIFAVTVPWIASYRQSRGGSIPGGSGPEWLSSWSVFPAMLGARQLTRSGPCPTIRYLPCAKPQTKNLYCDSSALTVSSPSVSTGSPNWKRPLNRQIPFVLAAASKGN
jgi:hypothetical protein